MKKKKDIKSDFLMRMKSSEPSKKIADEVLTSSKKKLFAKK